MVFFSRASLLFSIPTYHGEVTGLFHFIDLLELPFTLTPLRSNADSVTTKARGSNTEVLVMSIN